MNARQDMRENIRLGSTPYPNPPSNFICVREREWLKRNPDLVALEDKWRLIKFPYFDFENTKVFSGPLILEENGALIPALNNMPCLRFISPGNHEPDMALQAKNTRGRSRQIGENFLKYRTAYLKAVHYLIIEMYEVVNCISPCFSGDYCSVIFSKTSVIENRAFGISSNIIFEGSIDIALCSLLSSHYFCGLLGKPCILDAGRWMLTRVQVPGSLFIATLPPWSSIIRFTMASPNPEPPY